MENKTLATGVNVFVRDDPDSRSKTSYSKFIYWNSFRFRLPQRSYFSHFLQIARGTIMVIQLDQSRNGESWKLKSR